MKAIKVELLEEQEQRRRAKQAAVGRDEEEGLESEWSSSTNDIRNDPVEPLYDPHTTYHSESTLGSDPTGRYERVRVG